MDTADTIEVLSPPPGEPVTAPSSPTQEHGGAGGLPNIQGVPPHWPNWSREQDRTPLPHKHGKSKRRRRHPTLHTPNLPIPDLRYEQSFLSSIRSCVQILPESKSEKQQDEKDSDDDKAAAVPYTPAAGSEWWLAKNVKIAWGSLMYKVFVNQVVAQTVSGAVFFVVGLGWFTVRLGLRNLLRRPGAIARPPSLAG